ncbi:hypothetical protein [Rhizobium ecuadorense]|uniref:hypothetical protein n=1 Tax=Rhizobium ecuadorense TaxID=1671795 RepID=UPI001FCD0484|nr:hypothetical protein [Rhizobium ecuadorense]
MQAFKCDAIAVLQGTRRQLAGGEQFYVSEVEPFWLSATALVLPFDKSPDNPDCSYDGLKSIAFTKH